MERIFTNIIAKNAEEAVGKALGITEAWIARKGLKKDCLQISDADDHAVVKSTNGAK